MEWPKAVNEQVTQYLLIESVNELFHVFIEMGKDIIQVLILTDCVMRDKMQDCCISFLIFIQS